MWVTIAGTHHPLTASAMVFKRAGDCSWHPSYASCVDTLTAPIRLLRRQQAQAIAEVSATAGLALSARLVRAHVDAACSAGPAAAAAAYDSAAAENGQTAAYLQIRRTAALPGIWACHGLEMPRAASAAVARACPRLPAVPTRADSVGCCVGPAAAAKVAPAAVEAADVGSAAALAAEDK